MDSRRTLTWREREKKKLAQKRVPFYRLWGRFIFNDSLTI